LEGKNLGIVMPDADLDVAAEQVRTVRAGRYHSHTCPSLSGPFSRAAAMQATLGATSFNGQRCTAIKLVMVHEDVKVGPHHLVTFTAPVLLSSRCPYLLQVPVEA